MTRGFVVGAAAVMLSLVVTALLAFLWGETTAKDDTTIRRVTATEIANAMKNDRFYSDYGHGTLVMDGTVSTLSMRRRDLVATMTTNSSFAVWCDLGAGPSSVRPGDHVAMVTEGNSAERLSSGVFLNDCVIP